MKIIDSFIFYNELDLLKYRLSILNDYVDFFILVESKHTFSGDLKPLYYLENKELFEKYNEKIIHIVIDLPYQKPDIDYNLRQQWHNEWFQRNSIKNGLEKIYDNLLDEDIIIISDVDEIINPNILINLKNNNLNFDKNTLNLLVLDMYYYNLNTLIGKDNWNKVKLLTFETYKKINMTCDNMRMMNHGIPIIFNGGWHLSYFGDVEFIKNKLKHFSHQEYNNVKYVNNDFIIENIKNKKSLFDQNHDFEYIPVSENTNLPPLYDIYLKKYYIE